MKIDFKKELESASKSMIMIHNPKLLIKLIVRMIVRKLMLKHAAMILFEPDNDSFVLSISRGQSGIRIPPGFTRFTDESPIIKLFKKGEFHELSLDRNALLSEDINKMIWRESLVSNGNGQAVRELLHQVDEQMQMLNATACVPAYYHDDLLAILLLGEKNDGEKFDQEELDFFAALASDAAMAIRNAQLFEGLEKEAERNRRQFIQTIIVLSSTIEAKDAYTHGHTERVTQYALIIARELLNQGVFNFSESFLENLYISALLHDIGKMSIPDAILHKRTPLTDEEYLVVRAHSARGSDIIKPLMLPKECLDGIRHHHEMYDGRGYPDGLKGDDIPLTAAIIAVADTFDAMTTDRPYRQALPREVALQEIHDKSGSQFHPLIAQAMLEACDQGKI